MHSRHRRVHESRAGARKGGRQARRRLGVRRRAFTKCSPGGVPFAGDDVSDVLASVLAREPDWSQLPGELPPTVAQYLRRCLHKDAKRRVRDLGDVLLALEGAFDTQASTAARRCRRNRRAGDVSCQIAAAAMVARRATGLRDVDRRPAATSPTVAHVRRHCSCRPGAARPPASVVAVAPDGRAFAYRAVDGLYLRSLADLEPRLIPGRRKRPAAAVRARSVRGAVLLS